MNHTPTANNTTALRASLSPALTFHASFDNGPDADFALGDKQLYSTTEQAVQQVATFTPGLGEPALTIVEGQGKFGAALAFTQENSHVVVYKAAQNVAYDPTLLRGTVSFWMNLDPAEIPGQYSDPLQLTDKDYSNACIWIDFTKNDKPSDLRLGFFGNQSEWDVTNRRGESSEFFWRLVKVAEPPFTKGHWTHIAITWDGVNSAQGGRARLYLNGEYQGASGRIAEPFTWDVANATIRLGMGHFVGLIDDLALFNRPLTPAEVRGLYELDQGVAALHP